MTDHATQAGRPSLDVRPDRLTLFRDANHPRGPMLATATATPAGWTWRSSRGQSGTVATRSDALAALALLAGPVPCHCGRDVTWRTRPAGQPGCWVHIEHPRQPHLAAPVDPSWGALT